MEAMPKRVIITIIIVLALTIAFFFITGVITQYTGFAVTEKTNADDFKNCLRDHKIILYVNTNDLSETLKETNLNNYLDDIKIVNCLRDNQFCLMQGIISFQDKYVWVIEDKLISGDITIQEISELSGCKIVSK